MSATAIITMVLVLAFVWGGFLLILATAVRKERGKTQDASAHPPPGATPDEGV